MSRPFNTPDAFRAIADPTRRKMLLLLRQSPRTPTELFDFFQLSQPSISQHLRTLRLAGLIQQRRRGTKRVYRLAPYHLHSVAAWLKQILPGRT